MRNYRKPNGRGPKPTWHRDNERQQVLAALQYEPPDRNRERFLTPTSARREEELLGKVKIGEFGEVKP